MAQHRNIILPSQKGGDLGSGYIGEKGYGREVPLSIWKVVEERGEMEVEKASTLPEQTKPPIKIKGKETE